MNTKSRDRVIAEILRLHDIHDLTDAGLAAMEDCYETGRLAGIHETLDANDTGLLSE